MERKKKTVNKVLMTDGKLSSIQQLLLKYNIKSTENLQEALKDLLGRTNKEMILKVFPQ